MSGYLRVKNFWKYQNADVWKKCDGHPPWFKHFVHRDRELDQLPVVARLLFSELLGSATRNSNVLQDDLNWICSEVRMTPKEVAQALPMLVKGGWLSQSSSARRSRAPSRKTREETLPLEGEREKEKTKSKQRAVGLEVDAQPSDEEVAKVIELSLRGAA